MKNILLFLLIMFLAVSSFGQQLKDSALKNYYLAKAKKNRNTAWILLGTGASVATIGLFISSMNLDGDESVFDIDLEGPIIALAGGITMLISIPYFIDAKIFRNKAASITMGQQRIQLPVTGNYGIRTQPTITLRIGF
jgi:hypothetical protein